jgi:TonB family protein
MIPQQYIENRNEQKGRTIAIIVTVLFHALVILILVLLALRTPLPLPGEEGVEVNIGNSDVGMGDIQPEEAATLKSNSPPPSNSQADDEAVTENTDETPAIEKINKKVSKNTQPSTTNATKPQPEAAKVPVTNPKALYPGKSNKNTQGGSQGITGQPGDQGKPKGTPGSTFYDGLGGQGGGIGYDLGGRGAKNLPKPKYTSDEQGDIVVEIKVDRDGRVTYARAGARGTTISDQTMQRQAEEAARGSIFARDPSAPEEQKGTITYKFRKMK